MAQWIEHWSQGQMVWVDSHCWPYVELSGKLPIPHCLCLLSSDGYLVDEDCV